MKGRLAFDVFKDLAFFTFRLDANTDRVDNQRSRLRAER